MIKNNFFKVNNYSSYQKMPTSGFVKMDMIDKVVFDYETLLETEFNDNDYVWLLKTDNNSWMVYKYVKDSDINEIQSFATYTTIIANDKHNLEENDIVFREQFNEIPPRVEYSLTKHGEELIVALKGLADWGSKMASN